MPIMDEIDLRRMLPPRPEEIQYACMCLRMILSYLRPPVAGVPLTLEVAPDGPLMGWVERGTEVLGRIEGPGLFFRGDIR